MDNKLFANLSTAMAAMQNVFAMVKTGEGMGIPEDKKEEFFAEMKKQGLDTKIQEAEDVIAELNNKMNNGTI